MTDTDLALVGLVMVGVGGMFKGLADRLGKEKHSPSGFQEASWFFGFVLGGAGFLWHGHLHVSNFWSLILATIVCFIIWGLGYSVTRPR